MSRRIAIVALAVACLAPLSPPVAQARGGIKSPTLTVPSDWPASIPVPDGEISEVQRDLAGDLTLSMTAPSTVLTTITGTDELYTSAGFALHPDSTNPRYLTRADHIVVIFFRAHDFMIGETDLVIIETAVPGYDATAAPVSTAIPAAPAVDSGPIRAI